MAFMAALTGCGVIEDDRPMVVGPRAPVANGVVIEDLPALDAAPPLAETPTSGPIDRASMGYGSTYGSTLSGAYGASYGAAYKSDGAVLSYGYYSVYNGSSLYRNAYGYKPRYGYGFPAYVYGSPYGAYRYGYPSLYGYGYRGDFGYGGTRDGFYRGGWRTVGPVKKDKFVIEAESEEEAFAALDRVMQDQGYELQKERPNGQRVYIGRDRINGNEVFYVARLNANENRRGFAVRLKEAIRPRDPTIHHGVGRLVGHRYERALDDESRSLRKQLKRAQPVSASPAINITPPSRATSLLSTQTKVKKAKPSGIVNLEPQRMKPKKNASVVAPRIERQVQSPRRAERLQGVQSPIHRRSEGGNFRQAGGGKRKGGGGSLMPLP